MAASSDIVTECKQQSCPLCTFEQSVLNTECVLCGTKFNNAPAAPSDDRPSDDPNFKSTRCGSVVYVVEPFDVKQLERDYALFVENGNLRGSSWSIYLFGDNDIDRERPPQSDREMVSGSWSVLGRYDESIAFGITTTFYSFKPMISWIAFKQLMDSQFETLWTRFVLNGHCVLIPSPSTLDLQQNASSFCEDGVQIIFHKLMPDPQFIDYSKYIQFKIDEISARSHKMNNEPKTVSLAVVPSESVFDGGFDYLDEEELKRGGGGGDESKDEWDGVSDFVLTEYIRDTVDGIDDLFASIDEFMRRMAFLGVNSERSRSRALALLEELRNRKEAQRIADEMKMDEERQSQNALIRNEMMSGDQLVDEQMAQRLADGHILESFVCCRCHKQQDHGGLELSICSHRMCYRCFPQLVSSHIGMRLVPTCLQCGSRIHETDIRKHVNHHTADIVSDMAMNEILAKTDGLKTCFDPKCGGKIVIEDRSLREWKCPICKARNCLKCKKIHRGKEQCPPPPPPPPPPMPMFYPRRHRYGVVDDGHDLGNYHFSIDEFISFWVNIKDIDRSQMISTFDVAMGSTEWKKVICHLRDPSNRKIHRIQRVQNASVWRSFNKYCLRMKRKNKHSVKVGGFWHGTRTHDPALIWKQKGFLKSKSRIGNCLWFATENTYSMNGFQHVLSSGKHQCFLAFVCCGNASDVKFIRSNQILNVYQDAATYPAYLLTYT